MLPDQTTEQAILNKLSDIYDLLAADLGKVPNFYVKEFDLPAVSTGDAAHTVNADFEPDRWIVWMRTISNGKFRVANADSVPAVGAVEVESGSRAVLESVGQRLTFMNTSTSVDAHIFAVAVGGGSTFEIGAV